MADDLAIHLALRNRLLTVSGIPAAGQRAMENKKFIPTDGTPYIAEEYVAAPSRIVTIATDNGTVENRGFYIVKWYGVQHKGITAVRTGVNAIMAKFTPGTTITTSGGDAVRIAGNPVGPRAGQILPTADGWVVCVITIPFWLLTTNVIAA